MGLGKALNLRHAALHAITESEREFYDRSGIVHKLSDEELVYSLPYRLQGYILWAVYVDEQGITVDQPTYVTCMATCGAKSLPASNDKRRPSSGKFRCQRRLEMGCGRIVGRVTT